MRAPLSTSREARVRVPASTSNLGGGFDCVGMALGRWLRARVTWAPDDRSPPVITRAGTLGALDVGATDDLLYVGFAHACAARGHELPGGLSFHVDSEIPVARGLGSSAAALVAGATLASDLLGLGLRAENVATLCAQIEGHGDNAGPAALGGAVLSVRTAGGPHDGAYAFRPMVVHPAIGFAFAVPELLVSTAAARARLPRDLPHAVAVDAVARAAALVQGLATGDAVLLAHALDDVLHVPFRRALVPGYDAAVASAISAGAFGATLSGSGSALVAVAPATATAAVAHAMCDAWRGLGLTAEPLVVPGPAGSNGEIPDMAAAQIDHRI